MEYKGSKIYLNETEVEDLVIEYLSKMEEHNGFNLENIRIMPDVHPEPNSETLIGFTMKLDDYVVPNNVGSDVGCGVSGYYFKNFSIDYTEKELELIDNKVRNRIPMGKGKNSYKAPNRNYYHIKNNFPWDKTNNILKNFVNQNNLNDTKLNNFLDSGGYDIEYFKELCNKIKFDMTKAINGIGTLGGGNHFIEIGKGNNTGFWIITHTGSRSFGKSVSSYHQKRAEKYRKSSIIKENINKEYEKYIKFDLDTVSDIDLIEWVTGGKGESFIDYNKLKKDFKNDNPVKIEEIASSLKPRISEHNMSNWAYLKNEEIYNYYIDMLFCQMYASENRKMILKEVIDILELDINSGEYINSPHNIIDLRDSIIRKGATSAHQGEKGLIPFNMSDGVILFEGKGNPEWNYSVCHGAGRKGSRKQAKENITQQEAEKHMKGIYASEIPIDESKQAYKNVELIKNKIQPTVDIIDEIKPIINFKS